MSETNNEDEIIQENDEGKTSEDQSYQPNIKNELETVEDEEKEDLEEQSELESIYDPETFISGPTLSANSSLTEDILEFDYSYGYNCQKYFNLTVLDPDTLLFSSGNILHFFDVFTKEILFRRSALGGGIGHIRKNPNQNYSHFAVAESGELPIIIIYDWPTLDIVCVLKGGAEKVYANIDFNPNGDLLVSQSGEPDYLITVWDWEKRAILLRTKSYENDVFRVKFSPYIPGQITTCGIGHIKFWKMASTFTGLKLQGELGRFGKTEYSDIIGILPMPDAKVVSGCSWGNILVWDDSLITLEVFRSLRRKCHEAPIVQFFYFDRELWTVSMDGHIKIWWFEAIDQADPPDDDRVILTDPIHDFYTPDTKWMSIEKRNPHDYSDTFWYGQDGNGGIWLIDLNTEETPQTSEKLFFCNGGKVVSLASCPFGPYFASLGELGQFFIFDYIERTRIFYHKFPTGGSCMIWLSLDIDPTGEIILTAFEDGQVRVCCLKISEDFPEDESNPISLTIAQVIKPHRKNILQMSINKSGNLLVTAADDSTIFIFKINISHHNNLLIPIGFYATPDIVTCITWNYEDAKKVLLGCQHGQFVEVQLPEYEQAYTNVSFKLIDLKTKLNCFTSYKSQIKRDLKLKEIEEKRKEKLANKRKEMEDTIKENPELQIDEETFLTIIESEEELEPLHIPEVPNRIIWLQYTPNKTIWLSMGGYDAGYIYEYQINQKGTTPLNFRCIDGANDMEISTYVYTKNEEYLIFAMQDGSIRINKTDPMDYTNLTDYFTISMHDNQNGFISKLCFSYDEKYLFSSGFDGNIFSYKFEPEDYEYPIPMQRQYRSGHTCRHADDKDTENKLSLEYTKIKAEENRIEREANAHKNNIRKILEELKEQYEDLLQRNDKLLPSQIIPRADLELDQDIAEHIDSLFQAKIDLVKRKLAYDVEKSTIQLTKLQNYFINPCDRHPMLVKGINDPNCSILTVRQRKTLPQYEEILRILRERIIREQDKGRLPERIQPIQKVSIPEETSENVEPPLEFFLLSLSPSVIKNKLGPKLTRLLTKYRKRKMKWDKRAKEWESFITKKPPAGLNHPDDEKFLAEAKETFGNYKLKEDPSYESTTENRETTVKHFKLLLETRKRQYNLRHEFIEKVFQIRDFKYELIDKLKQKRNNLNLIHQEFPLELRKDGPPIPAFDPDEYPEENLQVQLAPPETEISLEKEILTPTANLFVEKSKGDTLENQVLSGQQYPKLFDGFFYGKYLNKDISDVMEFSFEQLLISSEIAEETPFESSLKADRFNRLSYYQTLRISQMVEMIDNFNNWIYQVRKERFRLLVLGNFMDVHMVCLNEELQILKNCDQQEDKLSFITNNKLILLNKMQDILNDLLDDKTQSETKLENFKLEENKIQEKFKNATENNKFYNFLKKVFKQKYKQPKTKTDDESSSSSSSSSDESDEDDDATSIDSKDLGFLRQDLDICPKGCEPAIYNLTIELRTKRHDIELKEREEYRVLDLTKKKIEVQQRQLRKADNEFKECKSKLEDFIRHKQEKLNNVRCTVTLYLDQIYEFNPESSDISDFIVFSKKKLTDLYARVGLLHQNAFEQQSEHDTYLKHLMRLNKDIDYMKSKVNSLKREIVELLYTKFGKLVGVSELNLKTIQQTYVNELEEMLMKKMIYELRIKSNDIKSLYTAELNRWQQKIVNNQNQLSKEIKENTKRLELLAIINKEKNQLAKFIDAQSMKKERVEQIEEKHKNFMRNIRNLEIIIEDQNKTMAQLREDIKFLKTKGMARQVFNRKISLQELQKELHVEKLEKIEDYKDYIEEIGDQGSEGDEEAKEKGEEYPTYYSQEIEDNVTSLVENIMQNVDDSLTKKSTENIIKNILNQITHSLSVHDIVQSIINNLPVDLSADQYQSVEDISKELFSLQEPQISEESLRTCIKNTLEETINNALCHDPHYLIQTILERLIETMPIERISTGITIDEIVLILKESKSTSELDKDELSKFIDGLPNTERMEILSIVNEILERVYGTGIDYLYIINRNIT